MKKIPVLFIIITTIIVTLTGCLYPQSELTQNQIPNEAQLAMVQSAVEQYQEKTNGLLPIKTKPSDTPIFEKYIIDFHLLGDENILAELPGNSYEKGGFYQYALIYPEENPTVKLIDVRIAQVLQDVYTRLNIYQEKNTYLPLSEPLEANYFQINFDKLGYKTDPSVISPFSHESLPIIIDNKGRLYVDYRLDLHHLLQENIDDNHNNEKDIRYLLTEDSPFLPIYSPNYIIDGNTPILIEHE